MSNSLKETTRVKRTAETISIHYNVHDDTEIRNVKSFLSHIKTIAELTKFLLEKCIHYCQWKPQMVLIMHHAVMEANYPLSDIVSMREMTSGLHHLEEGDQLVYY